jgi:hypothetical protein
VTADLNQETKLMPIVLALSISVGAISACATVQKIDGVVTSPQAQQLIQAGALAAVAAWGASLAAVSKVVNTEIAKLNLPAAEVQAISIVEVELNAYIQVEVRNDPTLAANQAAVADVLKAFIVATGG